MRRLSKGRKVLPHEPDELFIPEIWSRKSSMYGQVEDKDMQSLTDIEALEGSIIKWERIYLGLEPDLAVVNCPLCHKYMGFQCKGCPVERHTKHAWCKKTPYDAWSAHWGHSHPLGSSRKLAPYKSKKRCPRCQDLAKRELSYLKRLLKERRCHGGS